MDLKVEKIRVGLLATNCYFVSNGEEIFVVDPGDESARINELIRKKNQEVKYILVTHPHADHIGALDRVSRAFPEATVIVSQKDIEFLKHQGDKNQIFETIFPGFSSKYQTVNDGDKLSFGDDIIEVVATAGHTHGSICYLIDDKLFSGDTLFYHSRGVTAFPGGDDEKMRQSLSRLARLDENITVYPGHLAKTTIKEEKRFGNLT